MQRCINCGDGLSTAAWRYDEADNGIHWICPGGEEQAGVYAPVPLTAAIFEFLSNPVLGPQAEEHGIIRRAS